VLAALEPDEPSAVEIVLEQGSSPFAIVCDHAGRLLPRQLGTLGLSSSDLESHIAWDIGAAEVARRLAGALDARLFLQRYSRLVIDCNRPLRAPDSIPSRSGGVEIPGNQGLTVAEVERRRQAIFGAYHARIAGAFATRPPQVLVSIHSFTPVLFGERRPFHAGVLYERDSRLATPMLALLRQESGLFVGDNQPYAASAETDYAITEYGERRGIRYVELEIRQDLLASAAEQQIWAERLARLLPLALALA
jgi:predicted N-formylglutamate amidohydrolase